MAELLDHDLEQPRALSEVAFLRLDQTIASCGGVGLQERNSHLCYVDNDDFAVPSQPYKRRRVIPRACLAPLLMRRRAATCEATSSWLPAADKCRRRCETV